MPTNKTKDAIPTVVQDFEIMGIPDMDICSNFANRCFKSDCSQVRIHRKGTRPFEAIGPGELWQDEKGLICFKIHLSEESMIGKRDLLRMQDGNPGEILGDNELFEFTATDYRGSIWQASSVIPNFHSFKNGVIAEGTIDELRQRIESPKETTAAFIKVHFLGKIKYPANEITETEMRIGGKRTTVSSSYNAAEVKLSDITFKIRDENEHTIVTALLQDAQNPISIASHIHASLQFVTGREHTILSIQLASRSILESRLYSAKITESKGELQPPTISGMIDAKGDFWRLFSCYFLHVSKNDQENGHPISNHISMAIESSVASLEAGVLALTVAVEAIAKNTLSSQTTPQSAELEDDVRRICDSISTLSISEATRSRALGLLRSLTTVKASDLIKSFSEQYQLPEDTFNAWRKLRNTTAHGSGLNKQSIEQTLRQRDKVITLLHLLVFNAIDYEGPFIHYGEDGWPISTWPILPRHSSGISQA